MSYFFFIDFRFFVCTMVVDFSLKSMGLAMVKVDVCVVL
jgi:hypothetical protein